MSLRYHRSDRVEEGGKEVFCSGGLLSGVASGGDLMNGVIMFMTSGPIQ